MIIKHIIFGVPFFYIDQPNTWLKPILRHMAVGHEHKHQLDVNQLDRYVAPQLS